MNRFRGGLLFPDECLLPRGHILSRILNESRVSHGRDKGAVDHSGRKAKRSHKIHKQNNAKVIGVIPDFVLERIVEKHALSFFPLTIVLANTDPTLIGWIGNLEAKMIADKSLKDSPMRWNVFMG